MNKTYRIRYSQEFANHLELILDDLEAKSPEAANKLRQNIKEKLDELKLFPKQWSLVESPVESLRKYRRVILIYDYLIFYVVEEADRVLQIIDIIHGRENIGKF